MKILALIICLLTVKGGAHAQQRRRYKDSYPELRITAFSIPANKARSLQISFTLRCAGQTPIALAQKQFRVCLESSAARARCVFHPQDLNACLVVCDG
jgi:hypothetical protein